MEFWDISLKDNVEWFKNKIKGERWGKKKRRKRNLGESLCQQNTRIPVASNLAIVPEN